MLVTPRLAELAGGVGEVVPLQIGGGSVPVRVAGVVERFPGTGGESVVGDRIALRTAINAAAPGAARENEVWLDVAPTDRGDVSRRAYSSAVPGAATRPCARTSRRRRDAIRSRRERCSRSSGPLP